jgi:hypothetical protein
MCRSPSPTTCSTTSSISIGTPGMGQQRWNELTRGHDYRLYAGPPVSMKKSLLHCVAHSAVVGVQEDAPRGVLVDAGLQACGAAAVAGARQGHGLPRQQGPYHKAEKLSRWHAQMWVSAGSGLQNPAVLAYDKTGLRSAMSATNGERNVLTREVMMHMSRCTSAARDHGEKFDKAGLTS